MCAGSFLKDVKTYLVFPCYVFVDALVLVLPTHLGMIIGQGRNTQGWFLRGGGGARGAGSGARGGGWWGDLGRALSRGLFPNLDSGLKRV